MPTVDGIAPSGLGMYATCWWFSACLGRLRPALVGCCSIGSSIQTSAEMQNPATWLHRPGWSSAGRFPVTALAGVMAWDHTRGARPGNGVAQPNPCGHHSQGQRDAHLLKPSGLGVPMRLVGRVDGPAGKPACLSARPLSTTLIP
jgi:hypothetical protein